MEQIDDTDYIVIEGFLWTRDGNVNRRTYKEGERLRVVDQFPLIHEQSGKIAYRMEEVMTTLKWETKYLTLSDVELRGLLEDGKLEVDEWNPETPDEWYEYHYGKPRPKRYSENMTTSWSDIRPEQGWDELLRYVNLTHTVKGLVLRHGDVEVVEETGKAVKVSGELKLDDEVYSLHEQWIPKFLLKQKENDK